MSSNNRSTTYSQAINEAFHQIMESDRSVFLMGQGLESPWYVGNTATGLLEKFGASRVIDTPVSENAVTGAAVGAAIAGARTVVVHPRLDFMLYAMDPIINEAANWHYMNGGTSNVPVVFWGCVNRGGEQGAQHSQSIHAFFAHTPGLKVVMPSTPYDAKGLMISAIKDNNPVVFIDDRWLHKEKGLVPSELYEIEIGKADVAVEGSDITIVAVSYMANMARKAAVELAREGISIEVIDLRTIKPLDVKTIIRSVKKTGRLIVADTGWKSFGVAAEVLAMISEDAFGELKSAPKRLCLPDCPAPSSKSLESIYYPGVKEVVDTIKQMIM